MQYCTFLSMSMGEGIRVSVLVERIKEHSHSLRLGIL
jgi:hypothetical protein